jgi:hypothetical protein
MSFARVRVAFLGFGPSPLFSFNTLSTNINQHSIHRPMAFKIFSNLETSDSSSREAQFGRNRFQKEQRSVRHIMIVGHPHTQSEADYSLASVSR